jgi:hypothetical protein
MLATAVLLVVASGFANAQSQFGSVVGTVTDSSGAPIPGVAVRAVNEGSSLGFSTVTGSSGNYEVGGLLPGLYTIEAKKDGFASNTVVHVPLEAGVPARANISMSPGAVTQNIVVSASSAQLSTESATVVAELAPQFLHAPTFIQATQMVGDVLLPYMPGQFYLGGRAVAAYGSRSYDRRETVDGAVFGIAQTQGIRMPRGTVSDLQAVSLIADAEHQTSNSSEMFTAKGTNDIHGSFWTELQNGALNQLPFYAPPGSPKPGIPTVGLGFMVGGPVYVPKLYNGRDKTFFFATYQKYWLKTPENASGTAANNAMRAGDFSSLGTDITDPQTGQPFPNAIIPASRISSIAQSIYNKYFPSISGAYASPDFPVFTTINQPFWDLFVRGDHQFGTKDLLSVSYLHNHQIYVQVPGAATGAYTSGPPTTGLQTATNILNFVNVSENHIFNPRLLNEANFGVRLGVSGVTTSSTDGSSLLTSLGLPTTPGAPPGITGGPIFNITGQSALAFGTQNSTDARIWTFQDNLTKVWGRNNIKVGFELVKPTSNAVSYTNLFGTYGFSGFFTQNPFADYILGLPSTTSRALPPGPLNKEQQQLGFYASDSLHIAKNLTINLGLRIDHDSPAIETHGKYYNFDLATGQVVVPNENSLNLLNPGLSPDIRADIVTAANAKFPNQLVNPLWYVNPRVGFAYQLDNNMVLRAGFGIYGTLLNPGAPTGGVFTPGVQNATNTNTCNAGTCTAGFDLTNPFPSSGAQAVSGLSIAGTKPGLKAPKTYQWQLSLERRLSNALIARLTYAGSHSSQLVYQRNVNLPPASTIPFSQSRLVYPLWFSVNYADSGGNQSFNALDAEIKRQLANGLTFDADYGWSKCFTDDDEGGLIVYGGTGLLGATIEDPYNRSRDKGNCEEIPANFFRSTFTANSPFGTGGRWLANVHGVGGGVVNGVIGGWTISGMFLARSGHFFTPYITGIDAANTGQTLIRPDRVCSGVAHPQRDNFVFDPSCFVAPPNGRYGNAGMGILNGLGAWQFDSGIYKYITFAQSERVPKLRVGMNSINTLGHPAKDIDDIGALIVNSPATVARADDSIYTNGATANLGEWRHIYFEMRLEW